MTLRANCVGFRLAREREPNGHCAAVPDLEATPPCSSVFNSCRAVSTAGGSARRTPEQEAASNIHSGISDDFASDCCQLNKLYHNLKDGRFREVGLERAEGCADSQPASDSWARNP
jgi:hypothetical protein